MLELIAVSFLLLIFVVFLLLGRSVMSLVPNEGNLRSYSFEFIVGFSFFSVLTLILLRLSIPLLVGGSVSLIASLAVVYARRSSLMFPFHFRIVWINSAIPLLFSMLVLLVLIPIAVRHGTFYAPPAIYDLPKHLLAITSMATSTQWPPRNPLYPSGDFAYNYLFYVLPAYIDVTVGSSKAHLAVFPIQVAVMAGAFVAALVQLSIMIGTPVKWAWMTGLFATFLGGLHPIIIHNFPPMGYQLGVEHLVDRQVWGEDPIVYATYIPQHMFAVIASFISLSILCCRGQAVLRIGLASIMTLAASTSSFILLPHVNVLYALGLIILLMRNRTWYFHEIACGILIMLGYACILLVFATQARGWAPPHTVFASLQPIGRTDIFLIVSYGLTGLLGILGLAIALRRDRFAWHSWPFGLGVVGLYISTIVFIYPDSGLKGAAALRMMLVVFAGRGCAELLSAFPQKSARLLLASAILASGLIGVPFIRSLLDWKKIPQADAASMSLIQDRVGPILIEDGVQWDAALAGRPVTMDFRGYRSDSYLPYQTSLIAADFFDRLREADPQTIRNIASRTDTVVTTTDRIPVWRHVYGDPVIVSPSRVIFARRRDTPDAAPH